VLDFAFQTAVSSEEAGRIDGTWAQRLHLVDIGLRLSAAMRSRQYE
jgi:hypothetical protein